MKSRWFLLFFFISGFCSLVYELVWLRLCMAKFGVTTPTVSIVLSVFMAGLGLGSWLGGILMRRNNMRPAAQPLRLYGTLELLIGMSAFIVPWTIRLAYGILRDAHGGAAWGSDSYYLASGAWIALALLPWCTCMGATFPFAMAAIRRLMGKGTEHSFSYLYLANVLGSVLGVLVPTVFLIELFGFTGALYTACTLNLLLALLVFILSFSLKSDFVPQVERTPAVTPAASQKSVLWMLFVTGICSLAIEVVWIREYTFYLGNVVYAFAGILAIYLVATYAGSCIYRLRVRQGRSVDGTAAWICIGLAALLPLLFADPRVATWTYVYRVLRAVLGIAPFSALAGYLTPMFVDRWSYGVPDRAGRAYAVNVLGSILGPLVSGFAIIPLMGERWGLCCIAAPLFAVGLFAALREFKWRLARPVFTAAVALSILMAVTTRGYEIIYGRMVLLRDSTATVIATGQGMRRELLVNGIGMTQLTTDTKMMAHMPLAMLQRPPHNGLVICFGMGTSFRSMRSWGIPTTAVELVPSVPKLFGYYHSDAAALLESPLAQVVVDDGRRLLERSSQQFDVIITDPPPPVSAPTSSLLYSEEFYGVVKAHLRPGGVVQIWVPSAEKATLSAVAQALKYSFPYVRAFSSIEGWGIHFFASMQPLLPVQGAELARKLPARAAQDLLEWKPDCTPEELFDRVLKTQHPVTGFIAADSSVPAITDNRPVNEYFLLRKARAQYDHWRDTELTN